MQTVSEGDGDPTVRWSAQNSDEFGNVAQAFNKFVERVHHSMLEVATTTRHINEVVEETHNSSIVSLASSDEQNQRSSSIASSLNELGATAREIARNASSASVQASSAKSQAVEARIALSRKRATVEWMGIPTLNREFDVPAPNQVWCGDIAYIWLKINGITWLFCRILRALASGLGIFGKAGC